MSFVLKSVQDINCNIYNNYNYYYLKIQVPNIAIIGSGGGMRAAVGMCGVMTALQDIGIYDCAMYTAGLSGSAWLVGNYIT